MALFRRGSKIKTLLLATLSALAVGSIELLPVARAQGAREDQLLEPPRIPDPRRTDNFRPEVDLVFRVTSLTGRNRRDPIAVYNNDGDPVGSLPVGTAFAVRVPEDEVLEAWVTQNGSKRVDLARLLQAIHSQERREDAGANGGRVPIALPQVVRNASRHSRNDYFFEPDSNLHLQLSNLIVLGDARFEGVIGVAGRENRTANELVRTPAPVDSSRIRSYRPPAPGLVREHEVSESEYRAHSPRARQVLDSTPGHPFSLPICDCRPRSGNRACEYGQGFDAPRGGRRHGAIDIKAGEGTPIIAPADGCVTRSPINRFLVDGGYTIELQHSNGYVTRFMHMKDYRNEFTRPGQRIDVPTLGQCFKRGDRIGTVGQTGNQCTAPHLHFEVLKNGVKIDPRNVMGSSGSDPVTSNATIRKSCESHRNDVGWVPPGERDPSWARNLAESLRAPTTRVHASDGRGHFGSGSADGRRSAR